MRSRRVRTLESEAATIMVEAFDRECKNRSIEEIEFFAAHGYWPEAANVVERTERSFTVRGLKTTIILEPE